jgi:hypothetical protein
VRRLLAETIGVSPGQGLVALEAAILDHDPGLDLPPAGSPDAVRQEARATAVDPSLVEPEHPRRRSAAPPIQYVRSASGVNIAYQVTGNDEFLAQARSRGGDVPDVVVAGEVVESDPPRRLVTTFRMLMDPEMAAETSTITHEIKDLGGFCSLTVVHELAGAPRLAALVSGSLEEFGAGGGHAWVLSDLKSLLETGATLAG